MMYGPGNRMTRPERVQMYYSMLVASPGLVRLRDTDASEMRSVKDFATACLAAAVAIDAEFEKMTLLDV
jgi:hypothetical protein